nr:uncharacterized protein LOC120968420 [Aegilops tauschii subsp. strangulata]
MELLAQTSSAPFPASDPAGSASSSSHGPSWSDPATAPPFLAHRSAQLLHRLCIEQQCSRSPPLTAYLARLGQIRANAQLASHPAAQRHHRADPSAVFWLCCECGDSFDYARSSSSWIRSSS